MFFSDYHTHTIYSHGKGTVLDSANAALAKGLKEIAITDHGFGHKAYGIRRKELKDYLCDIESAGTSCGISILKGIECNILNSKGDIDLRGDDYEWIDVLICGHHKYVKGAGIKETFKFNLPVFLSGLLHKSSAKRIVMNTDAFIKMMECHPVDIISHPNLGICVDMKELGRAAAHYNVFLEINGKGVRYSPGQAHAALEQGAQFIADSDAHSPQRIGDFSKAVEFINLAQIPLENIVNYNKLPQFKSKRN